MIVLQCDDAIMYVCTYIEITPHSGPIDRPISLNQLPPSNTHNKNNSSSTSSAATATAACCCLSLGLLLLLHPPHSHTVEAFLLPQQQPPRLQPHTRPTTSGHASARFVPHPTHRPRRRLFPGSLPLGAAATTEPPTVAAAPAPAPAASHTAESSGNSGGRSALTVALDELALKGRHQEALALLRSARDGSHPVFGPGEVGPVQYHKVREMGGYI